MSHNWFVAATQMGFSAEQRKTETTSSTRIAAGLILGLACFAAVLTGGIFVGQTIGEALSTLQTIGPVAGGPASLRCWSRSGFNVSLVIGVVMGLN